MAILAKSLSGHNLKGDHWNAKNLLWESFSMGSMFIPNFKKIKRGEDFFLLIWHGMTLTISFTGLQQHVATLWGKKYITFPPISFSMSVTHFHMQMWMVKHVLWSSFASWSHWCFDLVSARQLICVV